LNDFDHNASCICWCALQELRRKVYLIRSLNLLKFFFWLGVEISNDGHGILALALPVSDWRRNLGVSDLAAMIAGREVGRA